MCYVNQVFNDESESARILQKKVHLDTSKHKACWKSPKYKYKQDDEISLVDLDQDIDKTFTRVDIESSPKLIDFNQTLTSTPEFTRSTPLLNHITRSHGIKTSFTLPQIEEEPKDFFLDILDESIDQDNFKSILYNGDNTNSFYTCQDGTITDIQNMEVSSVLSSVDLEAGECSTSTSVIVDGESDDWVCEIERAL